VTTAENKRLLTEAYDLDKPDAPGLELERWMRYARSADGPVLEVMCGSGRFLLPLALAGIDIDGTDPSVDANMLGISASLRQDLEELQNWWEQHAWDDDDETNADEGAEWDQWMDEGSRLVERLQSELGEDYHVSWN